MSKKIYFVVFIVSCLILFYYAIFENKSDSIEIEVIYKHDYWDIYNYSNGKYPTQQSLEDEIHKNLEEIAKLIGKEDWMDQYIENGIKKIYISVEISDRSLISGELSYPSDYVDNSIMFTMLLNSKIFTGQRVADIIGHELTHLITYQREEECYSFSQFLNEGLCNYVQEEITKKNIFEVDVHEYAVFLMRESEYEDLSDEIRKSYQEVINNIGTYSPRYIYKLTENDWWLSYVYGSSYAKYIIENFGIETYMDLHRPLSLLDKVEERERENELYKVRWLEFLENNYPTMTREEVISIWKNRLSE